MKATGEFVDVAGRDVHYCELGANADEAEHTLVSLHGFTSDHRLMAWWLEPVFANRPGWRRIHLDLPGMGLSDGSAVNGTDDVFRITRQAIDALVPGSYAVAGESYGAHLARGLVAADPDRLIGLALVAPMVVSGSAGRDVPPRQVLHTGAPFDHSAMPDFLDLAVVDTEEVFAANLASIAPGIAIADQAAIERITASYAGSFKQDPDSPYMRPSLIVTGRQDDVVGYRDQWIVLEQYPRATFAVLDRAGHNVHIEQPDVVFALTTDWLTRIEETARAA